VFVLDGGNLRYIGRADDVLGFKRTAIQNFTVYESHANRVLQRLDDLIEKQRHAVIDFRLGGWGSTSQRLWTGTGR
jgi:hypothetical protein